MYSEDTLKVLDGKQGSDWVASAFLWPAGEARSALSWAESALAQTDIVTYLLRVTQPFGRGIGSRK